MTELSSVVPAPAGPGAAPLRIGVVAPPWISCPPQRYGGTELVIDVLARGLVARGHEVLLFATGDSTCPVERAWVYDKALGQAIGTTAVELNHAAAAYEALAGCDVVHDHTLAGLFIAQIHQQRPVVTTNHGPFVDLLADVYRRTAPVVPLIAISEDQARSAPADVAVAAVIHHGLDLDGYRFSDSSGEYLVALGRFTPDKGIDRAIGIARRAGVELKIAAKCSDPAEMAYFADQIKPRLGNGVEYVGEVDHDAKVELLAGAKALLNPIRWPEPFGLVNIEALACGTPVIGTDWGAVPELVTHNETGYIVHDDQDLVRAVADVDRIDRATCHKHATERFAMDRMAADHERLYRQLITAWHQPKAEGRA